MSFTTRRIEYFNTTVRDRPGEASRILSELAKHGVNLLAFTAVPVGPVSVQLSLTPEDVHTMAKAAEKLAMVMDGPHPALLLHGDDELGALADVHARLSDANIDVYAANAVTAGQGRYGYLIYLRSEDVDRALAALPG